MPIDKSWISTPRNTIEYAKVMRPSTPLIGGKWTSFDRVGLRQSFVRWKRLENATGDRIWKLTHNSLKLLTGLVNPMR
ncbi:hypothetical protein DEO72_LG10g2529 [Vigna unguiculata]|uniref:Uncharacterized protein n=1 Tax=Vigna unguiculata TaxID=3917 RepID=A0A4D6NC54_VIGUN|nr:hypothetical protein DEO72_LG10g2529 [Vigna unguiculata]